MYKIIFLLFLGTCLSVNSLADTAEDADTVFSWAEQQFPEFFYPQGQASQTFGEWYFRSYPGPNNHLGVNTDTSTVYVFGETFGGLLDVGNLSALMNLVSSVPATDNGCNGKHVDQAPYTFACNGDTTSENASYEVTRYLHGKQYDFKQYQLGEPVFYKLFYEGDTDGRIYDWVTYWKKENISPVTFKYRLLRFVEKDVYLTVSRQESFNGKNEKSATTLDFNVYDGDIVTGQNTTRQFLLTQTSSDQDTDRLTYKQTFYNFVSRLAMSIGSNQIAGEEPARFSYRCGTPFADWYGSYGFLSATSSDLYNPLVHDKAQYEKCLSIYNEERDKIYARYLPFYENFEVPEW